ncbi:MAG: winged helix-turn-helix domain-containing protein [Acidobacteria bacterium]|nr:winged helix-turn-helix domain-containing protein [Acidobacteriota bacterium]
MLRQEITALENSAAQTEQAIDSLLVTMRSGSRGRLLGRTIQISDENGSVSSQNPDVLRSDVGRTARSSTVSYLSHHRSVPSISPNIEPLTNRFSDRTITQACTLLLREAGRPLHVNELYNLLISGGMKFKGNNPTISIAVSLNRNRRFRKVDPGTFDLIMREAAHTGT